MTSPYDVKSPKARWTLVDVLYVNDPDNDSSLAFGYWDGKRRFACRWNGKGDEPGNPMSRGVPTWFILPDEFVEPLMKSGIIPADKRQLLSTLFKSAA
jgi:hypothetical protein